MKARVGLRGVDSGPAVKVHNSSVELPPYIGPKKYGKVSGAYLDDLVWYFLILNHDLIPTHPAPKSLSLLRAAILDWL